MGIDSNEATSNAPELGFISAISFFLVLIFLNKIDGDFKRIDIYLAHRNWEFIRTDSSFNSYLAYFKLILYVFISFPFISLITWAGVLFYQKFDHDEEDSLIAPIAVVLVGFSFMLIFLGSFSVKWNKWKPSRVSIIELGLGILLFVSYQLCANFVPEKKSYFGISAVFLCYNGMCVIVILFINGGAQGKTLLDIVGKLKLHSENDYENDETADFDNQLQEQYKDPEYLPTQDEIKKYFTVTAASKGFSKSGIFSGGIQKVFTNLENKKRIFVTLMLYIFALGLLVSYAFIIYSVDDDSKLGFVTGIATVTTDFILYFCSYARISKTANQLCFLAIAFRICLFGFGGDYWFYGYCLLYFILGILISYSVINQRFPLVPTIKYQTIQRQSYRFKKEIDLTRTSEFIFIFGTFMFAALVIILELTEPDGVPLTKLDVFECWHFALITVLGVIILFCFMVTYRIYQRKNKSVKEKIYYYFFFFHLDLFWAYVIATYFFLVVGGIVLYSFTDNTNYITLCCFLPLIFILFVNAYNHFVLNEYHILQNITLLNKRNKALERRAKKIEKKLDNYKETMKYSQMDSFSYAQIMNRKTNNDWAKGNTNKAPGLPDENEIKEVNESEFDREQSNYESLQKQNWSNEHDQEKNPLPNEDDIEEEFKKIDAVGECMLPQGEGEQEADIENQKDNQEQEEQPPEEIKDESPTTKGNVRLMGKSTFKEIYGKMQADPSSFAQIEDWRKTHSFAGAFVKGKLRSNDYHILFGIIVNVILIFLMSMTIQLENDYGKSYYGVHLGVLMYCLGLVICPILKYLATSQNFGIVGTSSLVLGFIIYFGYGIYVFVVKDSGDIDINYNDLFVIIYLFSIPMLISFVSGFYKLYKRKWEINIFILCNFIICIILSIIFTIALFIIYDWKSGVAIIVFVALVIYVLLMLRTYKNNNYYLPRPYRIINIIIVTLVCLIAMILSWAFESFENFVGFSITYLMILGAIFLWALEKIVIDFTTYENAPLFYSPWIFPIFKYYPEKEKISNHNISTASIYIILLGGLFWSVLLTIFYEPMHYGISVSTVIIVVMFFANLFFCSYTPAQLGTSLEEENDDLIKKAWLDAKKNYMGLRNALSLKDLVSYDEQFQSYQRYLTLVSDLKNGKRVEDEDELDDLKATYGAMDFSSVKVVLKNQWKIERATEEIYFQEIKLMVHFQLMIMVAALNNRSRKRKLMIDFITNKEVVLKANGIDLKLKGIKNPNTKYAVLLQQIQKMSPEKKVIFEEIRNEFIREENKRMREDEERERKAAENELLRQAKMAEKYRKKMERKNQNFDWDNAPLYELPDTLTKYERIIKEFRADPSFRYTDKDFDFEKPEITLENIQNRVAKWERAPLEMKIFKGEVDAMDVKQGMLGDCYFLSAISCLGEENVKNAIITTEEDRACGAFCVRLFRGGEEEEYVIVDDYFPQDRNGGWVFCKSESNEELWPMILEKAYAKFYGSYADIEAGKVQYALSDLTGGEPEEIRLNQYKNNVDALWKKLYHYHKQNYLMGAGSPEHELGDSAYSEKGIIQGHAYAILDLVNIDTDRLIKLRNPHGSKGKEWTGDWGDDSENWDSVYAKTEAKVQFERKADGVFWMSIDDFVDEFKTGYICRTFPKKSWKMIELDDEWIGESAEGLPSRANPKALLEKNPQFALRIEKPSTVFIKLTQHAAKDLFKGENAIIFLVYRNNGHRVARNNPEQLVGSSGGPINLRIVSSEIKFESTLDYPQVFTVMTASALKVNEGNGKFSLKVFCNNDFKLQLIHKEDVK